MRPFNSQFYCMEAMDAKIMERTSNQPTFFDSLTCDLGGRRAAQFFQKCDQLIPWNELAESLRDMYKNNTDKSGASNYPLVMMIKCIMLQRWFNLSDPMLEEMLCDRITDKADDESTKRYTKGIKESFGKARKQFLRCIEIIFRSTSGKNI